MMDASTRPASWIDIGAEVVDTTGENVGKVGYVVVTPQDMHMTDIVVNTGTLLGRDIVVPTDSIRQFRDGKVHLSIDKDALQRLPDYVEINFRSPPPDWDGMPGMYYPEQAVLWPLNTPYYPSGSRIEVNTPPGTVALHKGMDVVSSDEHKVGSIESLDEERASGDVQDVIIKQGLLFTRDTRVTADLVDRIEADRVVLKLTKEEVEGRLQQQERGGLNTL